MTTPNPTRGDALALSMTELRDWLRADGRNASGPGWRAFNQIDAALSAYRSTATTGERVRLAVWRDPLEIRLDDKPWCVRPELYIEATIPPRAKPVVVEGEVDG